MDSANLMKHSAFVLLAIGILGTAVGATAHEGHKSVKGKGHMLVKGGSSSTATTKKAAATAPAIATLPAASVEKVTLTGELIDTQCWFTHNGEGKGHAACAVKCAKGGQDLAFLDTRTGEMHSLIASGHGKNPNEGLYDHVGVPVQVRGTLYKRGTNSGLLLENVALAE